MTTHVVNTHEAKSRLSELIRLAEDGHEVIVARNGHPVVRLVSWQASHAPRVPSAWAGQVFGGDDLVDSDPDVLALFEDSAIGDLS
ncbi:MAG TPA: type II toxin-antitoxin system prevent-host-death family antitoxin [Microthrixaceae bacterium]|nr:type II toxin-antitoxin system prevent-host-death family antitoxin [Microthrixaceae bacterium]